MLGDQGGLGRPQEVSTGPSTLIYSSQPQGPGFCHPPMGSCRSAHSGADGTPGAQCFPPEDATSAVQGLLGSGRITGVICLVTRAVKLSRTVGPTKARSRSSHGSSDTWHSTACQPQACLGPAALSTQPDPGPATGLHHFVGASALTPVSPPSLDGSERGRGKRARSLNLISFLLFFFFEQNYLTNHSQPPEQPTALTVSWGPHI